jgi:hypothetical protein
MVPSYPVVTSEHLLLKNASLSPEISTAVFAGFLLGAMVLAFIALYRQYPGTFLRILQKFQDFIFPRQDRHEARLEKIICHHCNKGMGVYDPIYLTYKGESYIEGICSCCGSFVRARLN